MSAEDVRGGPRHLLVLLPVVIAGASLFGWWLGWRPGILSADSIELWSQIDSGEFTNSSPAAHALTLWVVTRVWESPAAVTLAQVGAMVALLVFYMRALRRLAVPAWAAAVPVLGIGLLPGPASALISVDVRVAYGMAVAWLFVESLDVARDPGGRLAAKWPPRRLGIALGAVWLFDHAGFAVFLLVVGALAVGTRRNPDLLRTPVIVAVGLFLLVQGPLFWIFGVDRTAPSPGEAYAPEIAAVLVHHPESMTEAELATLEGAAPIEVWRDAYRCVDGDLLLGDREFDVSAIRADPSRFRSLLTEVVLRHTLTVAGHRWCAASVLFLPGQPEGERFETYTYNVPPNQLGLERDTAWQPAFDTTKGILVRTDHPWNLWLFWRPGILVLPALAIVALLVARRRRRLMLPAAVFASVIVTMALTIKTSAYLAVFPAYLSAALMLPLVVPALKRSAVGEGRKPE